MMYRNRRWEDGERGQIVQLAAPGAMAREYTRLMARSRYHPCNRDVRHIWKRICQECVRGLDRLVQLTSELDGLDRKRDEP